jgi:hypothetical protein
MQAFLAQHRYSGRRSAEELLARLRAAPRGLAGEAEADAKAELVRVLVRSVRSSRPFASSPAASSTPSPTCPTAVSSCRSRAPGASASSDPRRAWRCPRALPDRSPARCRSRRLASHSRLRQEPRRRLPMGMQPPLARGRHLLRRQLAARLAMGRSDLRARASTRMRSPSRDPRPRARLAPRPLARLDRSPTLRSQPPQCRSAHRSTNTGLTQGVSRDDGSVDFVLRRVERHHVHVLAG